LEGREPQFVSVGAPVSLFGRSLFARPVRDDLDDARLILGDHHGQRAGLGSRDAAADRHVDDGDTGRRATGLDLADERPADSAGVDDRLQSLAYTERSTHTRARGRKKRKISDQFPTKAPLSAYLTRVQMWDLRSLFSNKTYI